jgi:hypothetical protein
MYNNSININGLFKMYSIKNNKKKQIDEIPNLIMNDVHNKVAKTFIGFENVTSYQIKHLAIGDDNTAVTATDTALGNEVYRVPFVAQSNPSQKIIVSDFYIIDSEFAGDIEELGIFCGIFSTLTLGTGNMLNHILWSYNKSSSEELLIEYQLTIS